MVIKPRDLSKWMEKIENVIAEHCKNGRQNQGLPDNALACGQFYGESVNKRVQRGLHGTAAAISILLASKKTENVQIAKKLLTYTKSHATYDPQNSDDELNTIKQSEILASIDELADEPTYSMNLKTKLLEKKDAGNGSWNYFLDEDIPSKVATSYVVLALNNKTTPDELKKSKEFLWKQQHDLFDKSMSSDINAIAIRSLILFVLACCKTHVVEAVYTEKDLKLAIGKLWNICKPLFGSAFEVTVEYYRKDKNQYLRLPWQIYLAHALLIVDETSFYSIRFQRYLSTMHQVEVAGGYKYEHGGNYFSTRTNGILYKFLYFAFLLEPRKSYLHLIIDSLSEAWTKPWVKLVIIFAIGFTGLMLSNQFIEQINAQSPIWAEVIGALFISALSWLYGTGRK